MTYDLDAVARAVRAVAPNVKLGLDSQRLGVTFDRWSGVVVWSDGRFAIDRSAKTISDRAIVRAVIDELDRQDAAAETTRPGS